MDIPPPNEDWKITDIDGDTFNLTMIFTLKQ